MRDTTPGTSPLAIASVESDVTVESKLALRAAMAFTAGGSLCESASTNERLPLKLRLLCNTGDDVNDRRRSSPRSMRLRKMVSPVGDGDRDRDRLLPVALSLMLRPLRGGPVGLAGERGELKPLPVGEIEVKERRRRIGGGEVAKFLDELLLLVFHHSSVDDLRETRLSVFSDIAEDAKYRLSWFFLRFCLQKHCRG